MGLKLKQKVFRSAVLHFAHLVVVTQFVPSFINSSVAIASAISRIDAGFAAKGVRAISLRIVQRGAYQ